MGSSPDSSLREPLRLATFRRLWTAQLASNIGTFMQNVGAVWLMGDLGGSTTQIALVQTATSLPVFLVGLFGGALADVIDRRRILLVTQGWMLLVALVLTITTLSGHISPLWLLLFTFFIGLGAAVNVPAWQAIQPELVPRAMLRQAIVLASTSMNLGRALGPAVGGVVVALAGVAWVFGLNSVSFVGVMVAVFIWRRPHEERQLPPERITNAIRTGIRYAANSPALRAVLVRTGLYITPARAFLALLPIVARTQLELDATGFGLLYACYGAGAVAAALLMSRLVDIGPDRQIILSSVGLCAALLVTGLVHYTFAVAVAAFVGGAAWTSGAATLNSTTQSVLPAWVRARGMSLYILTIQGGIALGSVLFGLVAQRSLTAGLVIPATLLLVMLMAGRRWKLTRREPIDLENSTYWNEPLTGFEIPPDRGPVLVAVEYHIQGPRIHEFSEAMKKVHRIRKRTGASRWGLYQDSLEETWFTETYVVSSWEEHLRQHQRTTATDEMLEANVRNFLQPGTDLVVRHSLWAY